MPKVLFTLPISKIAIAGARIRFYCKHMSMTLTPKAAEALKNLLAHKATSQKEGLRLGVEKGGCAGMHYTMQVTEPKKGDIIITEDEGSLLIAADSLEYLEGCELDYSDALSDAGFKIQNPNAERSCGCGTSFEAKNAAPEDKIDPDLDGMECR